MRRDYADLLKGIVDRVSGAPVPKLELPGHKVCNICKRLLPVHLYYRKYGRCVECVSAVRRAYYKINRDTVKATTRRKYWERKRKEQTS